MSASPWRNDPLYGGMSDESARRSWEAAQLQPPHAFRIPDSPEKEAEIELCKLQIETGLAEYEIEIAEAVAWFQEWKARQPKGFRATRIRPPAQEAAE